MVYFEYVRTIYEPFLWMWQRFLFSIYGRCGPLEETPERVFVEQELEHVSTEKKRSSNVKKLGTGRFLLIKESK